jgi:hypothetical protein
MYKDVQKLLLSCLFQLYGQIWPNPPTDDQHVEVSLHSSPQNWKKRERTKTKRKLATRASLKESGGINPFFGRHLTSG